MQIHLGTSAVINLYFLKQYGLMAELKTRKRHSDGEKNAENYLDNTMDNFTNATDLMSPMSRRWQSLKTLASSWKELLVTCMTCSQWRLRISCNTEAQCTCTPGLSVLTGSKQCHLFHMMICGRDCKIAWHVFDESKALGSVKTVVQKCLMLNT